MLEGVKQFIKEWNISSFTFSYLVIFSALSIFFLLNTLSLIFFGIGFFNMNAHTSSLFFIGCVGLSVPKIISLCDFRYISSRKY